MNKFLFSLAIAATIGLIAMSPPVVRAAEGDSIIFGLVRSAGAVGCLKTTAMGRVTVSDLGPVQNMHVEVFNLPPSTEFTVFIIQVPNKPFGLVWYQGDVDTNTLGRGVGHFTGIFSRETFINAPGVATAPKVFPDDATSNPATPPVQIYHLGMWFARPADAVKAGCPGTVTPFDGDHQAGIQVLNTSNFANNNGPLRSLIP